MDNNSSADFPGFVSSTSCRTLCALLDFNDSRSASRCCLAFIFSRFLMRSSSLPANEDSSSSAVFPGLVSSTSARTRAVWLDKSSLLDCCLAFIFSRFLMSSSSLPSYKDSKSSADFPGLVSSTSARTLSAFWDFKDWRSRLDFIFSKFLMSSSSLPAYVASSSSADLGAPVSSTRARTEAVWLAFNCCLDFIFSRFLISWSSLPS